MKLSSLIKSVSPNFTSIPGAHDPEVVSIHYRADQVQPGGLFVAIPGFKANGHDFIDQALDRGAVAIVSEKSFKGDSLTIQVKNTRHALSGLSAKFYGYPSEKLIITGITGTNGKTTTTYLLENILEKARLSSGVISTIECRFAGQTRNITMTTPESLDLQEILSNMVDNDVTHVVMEASSHAIDLNRIDHLSLNVGIFTNLSQDHLDYHKDMENYFSCKTKLFTHNLTSFHKKDQRTAVINCNNDRGIELFSILEQMNSGPDLITIGAPETCHISAHHIDVSIAGIIGSIATPIGSFEFRSSLVGKYNLENILCAVGAGVALNIPLQAIKKGIDEFSHVPGRLEPVNNMVKRHIFVDYAHTPDALENVLKTLKSITSGRLITIFGCGGDRDKAKRPQMGEIAGRLSDLAVITSDNPRTEDPMTIIEQITMGIQKVSQKVDNTHGGSIKGYLVAPDRNQAIKTGIDSSCPGDTILIAGKGHETYQIIGDNTISFDDRIAVQKIIDAGHIT
ncbi:MAG: UDP-N-acetylmuramoyl-L-alanyl-D-glutamate--2,6-diaminopimelate ligase [Desulfobacterales bacterium]|nr:UDP-N-acetylmuramoyl-L-alanyl-D-glutamate--2,6-diaminopimelate ligase [Desulfobacterales bacterium]